MIGINEMSLLDIREIEQIVKFKRAGKQEVSRMTNFTSKFIDNNVHICPHCSSQIKFAHKRIINWYEKNATLISEKKQLLINPIETNKCVVCNTKISDKRKKYCSKFCKDNK